MSFTTYFASERVILLHGDVLEVARTLPSGSIDCISTSPPYFGLRDYGLPPTKWPEFTYTPMAGMPEVTVPAMECCLGLEPDPTAFVGHLTLLFAELRRVLADDGTLWLNLGDSYSGYHGNKNCADDAAPSNKPGYWENMRKSLPGGIPAKNLLGIPWRVAFALQAEGWILRNDVIWHKTNAMPFSGKDRLASRHEHVFMFSKARKYWFGLGDIREPHADVTVARSKRARITPYAPPGQTPGKRSETIPDARGKNPGDVWSISTKPFPEAHFAVQSPDLAERCVLAGCKPGGTVLDPFSGSGTTGMVALRHGRNYIGVELSQDYLDLSLRTRFADEVESARALRR